MGVGGYIFCIPKNRRFKGSWDRSQTSFRVFACFMYGQPEKHDLRSRGEVLEIHGSCQ